MKNQDLFEKLLQQIIEKIPIDTQTCEDLMLLIPLFKDDNFKTFARNSAIIIAQKVKETNVVFSTKSFDILCYLMTQS